VSFAGSFDDVLALRMLRNEQVRTARERKKEEVSRDRFLTVHNPLNSLCFPVLSIERR
jgi:hypothetical protein